MDEVFKRKYITEKLDLYKEKDEYLNKIKSYIEKGKSINEECNKNQNKSLLINDYINIEKMIDNMNKIKENMDMNSSNYDKIEFISNTDNILELIKKLGNIKIKGDLIHNSNELELITKKINVNNQKLILNLLYKASEDSDKAEAFHSKCDQAKSTLVLIETNKGKRFGGFTSCSWKADCFTKKDECAFIFSLDKMKIFDVIPGEEAIGCYPKYGPVFLGCQIRIFDDAFIKGGSTFERGCNYNTEEDYELTGGDKIFGVKEIEVYEVLFE